MRFQDVDRNVYSGRSYEDVVRSMSGQKLTKPHSLATYRRATAKRIRNIHLAVRVKTDTNKDFILSLVEFGFLKRLPSRHNKTRNY